MRNRRSAISCDGEYKYKFDGESACRGHAFITNETLLDVLLNVTTAQRTIFLYMRVMCIIDVNLSVPLLASIFTRESMKSRRGPGGGVSTAHD